MLSGATMYMRFPRALAQGLPEGKSWIKLDLDRALGGKSFSSAMAAGADPSQYLRLLAATGDTKSVGTEPVGARRTTHYTATIDYREVAKSGPGNLRALARQSLRFIKDPVTKFDVWIDGAGLVRRQRFHVETKPVGQSPAQDQDISIELPEYGVDTRSIAVPDAAQTYDATNVAKDALGG